MNVDHTHVFWKCLKIGNFWEMIKEQMQKILGYEVKMDCKMMYLGGLVDENVHDEDRYLVKILLAAAKKAITRKWGQAETPNLSQWKELVEGIYIMEKLTLKLRLQEDQMEHYWWKWTRYKEGNGNSGTD